MRVIAGTAKGRKLSSPKGYDTRPTSDRIKESLFNIISNDLEGSTFLDLFAGTGGIGIEAMSRGAKKCTFVENNKTAFDIVKENVSIAGFLDKSEIYFKDAEHALKAASRKEQRYDIIFMDPPYDGAHHMEYLSQMINDLGILNDNGYIIGEHPTSFTLSSFKNIMLLRVKKYGKTTLSFWQPFMES